MQIVDVGHEDRDAQVGHRAGELEHRHRQRQHQPGHPFGNVELVAALLDHRRQAGDRGLGGEGGHLHRGERARPGADRHAADDHHDRVGDDDDPDLRQDDGGDSNGR